MPVHPFDSPIVRTLSARKVIFLRFDLNDYSIPPHAVGRPLTLVATQSEVRILDGQATLARHRRSYGRGEEIKDPAHLDALLEEKRKALGSTPGGRLQHQVPASRDFLEAAFRRGESPARLTSRLLTLLEANTRHTGQQHLQALAAEAGQPDFNAFLADVRPMLARLHASGVLLGTRIG